MQNAENGKRTHALNEQSNNQTKSAALPRSLTGTGDLYKKIKK
jgi:hypothetical protein